MPKDGPLQRYYRRYSGQGLFNRYISFRIESYAFRQFAALGWCVLFAAASGPVAGAAALACAMLGDAIDTGYLRSIKNHVDDSTRFRRHHGISVLTATIHGLLMSLGACMPFLFYSHEIGETGHVEPVFTIGVLASAAIANGMYFALNKVATVARLLVFQLVLLGFVLTRISEERENGHFYALDLFGVLILFVTMVWFLKTVSQRHKGSRHNMLTQSLQRQELEDAYKRLTEQQKETQRLAVIAENASDSIFLMDQDCKILWANDSFTRVTGYTMQEALGKTPIQLLGAEPPSDQTPEDTVSAFSLLRPVRFEVQNRRKDGRLIWIEANQVPLFNEEGDLETVITVERDVTDAKAHSDLLEKARCAAEEGAQAKADFLATMSHEIRTPLNGVIGMAQMLDATDLNPDQREYSDTILSSAETLLALINDILDLSKMDAGEMVFAKENFDLTACFAEPVRLLTPQAAAKGIELELKLAPDFPNAATGDSRRIKQILLNTIGNAIKFTDKGGVTVEVKAHTDGAVLHLNVAVKDTGIGIAKDIQARIFERFSQADAAISRRFGGTGLGLTISRKLVELMGGKISVDSIPGEGTCFRFNLQLTSATAFELEPHRKSSAVNLAGLRILVAEDNQINRLLVEKFLMHSAAHIEFAINGREAIEKTPEFQPEVILMDMSMPEVNGLEATTRIRAMQVTQPKIIALTANAFATDREACLAAGMDDFMTKPVNRAKLLTMLEQYAPREDA